MMIHNNSLISIIIPVYMEEQVIKQGYQKLRDELLTLDTAANIYSAFIEQDSRI